LAAVVGADRFLAEIKTTANLQHPHILPLFDSGEADGFLFYVMPYVEGETLRERLEREHQLPVDEAVAIATKLASALQAAHEQGIVHRDVKPANILLSKGEPLVSDFGIALAVGAAGGGRLTETGLSLGTPHYMSPEQATGDLHVGPAADIYALGCVLYETLVGEPPFTGSTPQSVLGKIITGEVPSAMAERASVPPNVDAAVGKALAKLPADRFPSASAFRVALADLHFAVPATARIESGGRLAPTVWRRLATTMTGVAVVSVIFAAWLWSRPAPSASGRTVRFAVDAGPTIPQGAIALDPDGAVLVYSGLQGGEVRLFARRLDDLEVRPVPGTESAWFPFFSPDGAWLGFYTDRQIKRVPATGGPPVTIATTDSFGGATWGAAGIVVFSGPGGRLMQVGPDGGEPEILAEPDTAAGEVALRFPEFLPNGRDLLLTIVTEDLATSLIGVYSAEAARVRRLPGTGTNPHYAATGHLLFERLDRTVVAAPFDAEGLTLVGEAVPVLSDVSALALSAEGTLATIQAPPEQGHRLVLVDRTGAERSFLPQDRTFPLPASQMGFLYPRFSPSGDRIAISFLDNVYVYDLAQGTLDQRTFGSNSTFPSWTPDGTRIVFSSTRHGPRNLYTVAADGAGEAELLLEATEGDLWESHITPDGRWVAVSEGRQNEANRVDVVLLPLDSDGSRLPVAATEANERSLAVSPDGRWIAYVSSEGGDDQVYVRSLPLPRGTTRVSFDGGNSPAWARDGRTIFYRTAEGMEAAGFDPETGRLTERLTLFDDEPYARSIYYATYDVDPRSGDLLMAWTGGQQLPDMHVVLGWFEELERLVPN
jgi:hypothetical protein